jgi:hypothetical protein
MEQGRKKWVRRAAGVVVLGVIVGGTWAGMNATALKAKYAAHRLTTAPTDEEKTKWADTLASYGDAGLSKLVALVRTGEPAATAALTRHLDALPESDPAGGTLCGQLLDAFPACTDDGKAAVLDLLPAILKRVPVTHAARCREVVTAGLTSSTPAARLAAVRMAMHPRIKMRADLVPLLNAPEPEVRRAALFAVGPATDGDAVIGDEELFRWLHDADADVRRGCYDALVSRGRSEPEISLGRRLTNPDTAERLKLLMDLRYDDDVPDPEPWLERLSRDAEPAVRAGAARVAVEVAADRRQPAPIWVGRIADVDPDPTVRRVAGAEGVIRALLDAGAIGLVTTHDLALTDVTTRLPGAVNVHFCDGFAGGELHFDYTMRPGVVPHGNGLALMRAVRQNLCTSPLNLT